MGRLRARNAEEEDEFRRLVAARFAEPRSARPVSAPPASTPGPVPPGRDPLDRPPLDDAPERPEPPPAPVRPRVRAAPAAVAERLAAAPPVAPDAALPPVEVSAPEPVPEPAGDRVEGAPRPPRAPFGEILVERDLVDAAAVDDALAVQPGSGKRLGELLVEQGALSERDLAAALADQLGMDTVDLSRQAPDPATAALLTEASARSLLAVPLTRADDRVVVAVADPLQPGLVGALVEAVETPLRLVLAPEADLLRTIDTVYRATARVGDVVRVFEERARQREEQDRQRATEIVTTVDEKAPAVQVVNLILEQAVKDRASDVHIEPTPDRLRIRNRTDGALHDVMSLPPSMAQSLVSRIKVMADLNIVERRRPQDGQIEITVDGRELDIRVSTTSTVSGEKVVLRLLDKSRVLYPLHELGMPDTLFAHYYDLVRSPFGMVICAGPTGSGKTTTLYATLSEINRDEINVMTIEDPVEYTFDTANQIQINEQAGLTFATGLRSILRQDPDTILVGEIRDVETARVAVQAALTGHLVLSSLHATDATAAVHRFLDMGVESFLLSSALLGVVGQRLVRRVCPHCRVPYEPSADERSFWERATDGSTVTAPPTWMHGEGCNFCGRTGYLERTGVYEVLTVTPAMKQLIVDRAPHDRMKELAVAEGMLPMREQALALAARGETTVAEVMRVVYML
jgi:type IV pilus assembly protein PilB